MRKLAIMGSTALMLSACSMFQPTPGPAGPPGPPGPVVVAPAPTVSQVANDISLLATGLNNALSQPSVTALIPADTLPKVQMALADLMKLSNDVANSPSAAATKATVTTVENDVNTIVGSLAGLPLPPPAPTILTAATVLLPVIEAAVGMVVPAGQAHSHMNAGTARAHLLTGK